MDVAAVRRQIPATQNTIYVNTGWSGPSPRVVMDRVREWMEYENHQGPTSPPVNARHSAVLQETRGAIAKLINATPEEISLTQNTTEGLNVVTNGIDWRQGDEIITCNLEHASVLVPAYFQQQRHGVQVKVVELDPKGSKEAILERFSDAMTPRTRMIFVSHLQFSCGLRLPAKELAELAHGRGAWLLLDGAQGAGHVALDMREIDCDFYSMPGQKWLLGPDGVGALYVRRELVPVLQPWKVSMRAAQEIDRTGGFEPRTDYIGKFEVSTTSTALWAGLLGAIGFHNEYGSQAIEERAISLGAYAAGRLAEIPGVVVTSPTDPETRSGLVTFTVGGKEPRAVVEYLWQQAAVVARSVAFPPGVRISSAFFNTEEEMDRIAAVVAGFADLP